MVSKSLYEADKFSEALSEYKAAKPAIDAAATISSDFKFLTYLHGAQSANLANEHQQAIQFANALLAPETIQDIDIGLQQQAAMELGDAYRALEKWDEAIAAYADAAKHPGKTGARSMAMIGEIYIDKKDYALAIDKYKLVWYGYGGLDADETVKPWQAFANYQAARCNLFLATASPIDSEATRQYLERAKKRLEFLVINYPEDRLVENAQNQLLQLQ